MVGLLQKPMVIMYKFKAVTALIAKLIVKGTKFFGLVNLISGREIVPERWQEGATPEKLADLLARYIEEPQYRANVVRDLQNLREILGNQGATDRVAEHLERHLR
jgi:lipid-A-disaccharide synthase